MRRTLPRLAVVLAAFVLISCGALGTVPEPDPNPDVFGPERVPVTICTLPVMDSLPFWQAVKGGHFANNLINMNPADHVVVGSGGASCVEKVHNGEAAFGLTSWPPVIQARFGPAKLDTRVVVSATSLAPDNSPVMVTKDSPIKSVRDLAGKRIAISQINTASHLLVASLLQQNEIDPRSIQWVEVPFPEIAKRIASGDVDAGYLVEPYTTQAAVTLGLLPLADTGEGPRTDIALAGWVTSAEFARDNPRTVRLFAKAMRGGARDVLDGAKGRVRLDALAVEKLNVTADVANMAHLNRYHEANVTLTQLRRWANLMQEFGDVKFTDPPIDDELGRLILPDDMLR